VCHGSYYQGQKKEWLYLCSKALSHYNYNYNAIIKVSSKLNLAMKVLQARRFLTEIIEVLQYEALIIMMEILPGLVVCHGSYYQGQIKNMALPVLRSIKPPKKTLDRHPIQCFRWGLIQILH